MGRFADADLKTIPRDELFTEFFIENFILILTGILGSKTFGTVFFGR